MGCSNCGKKTKASKEQLSITKQMKKNQPQNEVAKILPFIIKGDKSKAVYFPRIQM